MFIVLYSIQALLSLNIIFLYKVVEGTVGIPYYTILYHTQGKHELKLYAAPVQQDIDKETLVALPGSMIAIEVSVDGVNALQKKQKTIIERSETPATLDCPRGM